MEKLFSVDISDCEVQTFRSGGAGGQNQNKRDSGVRVIHRPSGAVGESREERSQLQNKRNAFLKMDSSMQFQTWIKAEAARLGGQKPIGEVVDEWLVPENLRIEVREEGRWKEIAGGADRDV